MKEIPINFGETMAGNSNRQIADPAGMGNNEIDDVSVSPEVMTSLQMFQQQRLEISELYNNQTCIQGYKHLFDFT